MTREIKDLRKGKPTRTIMTFYYPILDILEIHLLPIEKQFFDGFDYGCLVCITDIPAKKSFADTIIESALKIK